MNLARLYYTLRPLRLVQWNDRLSRPLRARLLQARRASPENIEAAQELPRISLPQFATKDAFNSVTGKACFLNICHQFPDGKIDWNFAGHGMLWAYHLNYFGWLEQEKDAARALALMRNYCEQANARSIGSAPYPASRRIQHWIAVILRHDLTSVEVLHQLYADAWCVAELPEHHLQANHLLQNGFALFAAAHFFHDKKLYDRARNILLEEIDEQFLPDGAHIERSASYTADLCARLLWCLHLQRRTQRLADDELTARLRHAASGALAWLGAYSFSDGSMAAIGDSSPDMKPPSTTLLEAAKSFGIYPTTPRAMRESGYRKIGGANWEAVINAGSPAPAYQPGHSHADALTFCLQAHGKPLIVDTGISTYAQSARRSWERSTEAHNTVAVGGKNSSDVWASFRMGRRAQVAILQEELQSLTATHNGYRKMNVQHVRRFDWSKENALIIADSLEGNTKAAATSFLHFHPDVDVQQTSDSEWYAADCRIHFRGMGLITAEPYQWAAGFNLLRPALRLRCRWDAKKTEIQFFF